MAHDARGPGCRVVRGQVEKDPVELMKLLRVLERLGVSVFATRGLKKEYGGLKLWLRKTGPLGGLA